MSKKFIITWIIFSLIFLFVDYKLMVFFNVGVILSFNQKLIVPKIIISLLLSVIDFQLMIFFIVGLFLLFIVKNFF